MEDYGHCPQDPYLMVPWIDSGGGAPPMEWVEDQETVATTTSASRSHSEAEKRRRDRINAHLSDLRKLIPMSEKMDKAALLGQVVSHVKEQSKKAKEVSKLSTIPTEIDEVTIDHFNVDEASSQDDDSIYMKVSLCCEDRPELFSELNSAVKGLGITVVRGEITGLGGRMRTNLVLCAKGVSLEQQGSICQSLKLALNRVVISSGATFYSARSKRQRFFYPNHN